LVVSRERGIRTLDAVARITVFETVSFDHSDISLCGPIRQPADAGAKIKTPAGFARVF
jgi:hypothetical protein